MSTKRTKILYLGHASGESIGLGKFLVKALAQLDNQLLIIDSNAFAPRYESYIKRLSTSPMIYRASPRFLTIGRKALWLARKLTGRLVLQKLHEELWRNACEFMPDLVFVVRGHWLEPDVLHEIKQKTRCRAMFYHTEDFREPTYYSQQFMESIPIYDCIFTAVQANVQEYKDLGAQRVEYLPFGYDPEVHRLISLTQSEQNHYGTDVAFLGKWSSSRQVLLEALANMCRLAVWGYMWERVPPDSPLYGRLKGPVSVGDVARVIQASKIMLNPLNDQGRMQHVMRTFEIPACGGFQLAKKSEEHLAIFKEDKEIVCFESLEELKEKIGYYLSHERERQKIAQAGHERVLKGNHSYVDRMRNVLQVYWEIRQS